MYEGNWKQEHLTDSGVSGWNVAFKSLKRITHCLSVTCLSMSPLIFTLFFSMKC